MPWPNNLPHQLTSFVGRERELDQVLALLKANRLITLTGAGGSGKTRLALQAADLSRVIFPDGAWLVELATIVDPRLVPQMLGATLDVREEPDKPLISTLIDYLQPLQLLLVLDNCEHMVEACASLAQNLLRACPDLTVLATSRQGLGIEGEICWRVPSLSLPDPQVVSNPEDLRQFEAVQLFVERARQRRSDFALTPQNAQAVAQLCFRLDGIPLAIELAAARTRTLSVEQIVDRLHQQFHLLASASQSVLPRHKTLQAMMDWSYDLLTERERALFRALSVFANSFALDAVPAVVGGELDEFAAIDLLSQLIDKSLVTLEDGGGQVRYHMLETIRQYALKKTLDEGEVASLRDRHLTWCVNLAEQTEDELVSNRQVLWLERLEKEHDNLRSALTHALAETAGASPEIQRLRSRMALRLSGSLVWFWYFHGYLSEGRGWLESTLVQATNPQHDVALAKALSAAGVLAYVQSDYPTAHARLETSLAVWHELNDKRGTAFALTFLGRVLAQEGDPLRRELGERSVELFREIDDKWGLALSLDFLGEEAHEAGRSEVGRALHEESLSLYRQLGHRWGIALELSHFARVSLSMGDYADARRRLEEAVAIQRTVGDRSMLAWALNSLGDVMLSESGVDEAYTNYCESLELFREVEHRGGRAETLHKISSIMVNRRQYEAAWKLSTECLDLNRELNHRPGIVSELNQLGTIAQERAQYPHARSLFREALGHARALGDDSLTSMCIKSFAGLAAAEQRWEEAALLRGVADRARGDSGEGMETGPQPGARYSGLASSSLGGGGYDSLYRRGLTLSEVDGISLALHDKPAAEHVGLESLPANGSRANDEHDILTRRELEVLKLIAEGLTDAQVAERLVLSTRTVQAHVRSIYSKLDITTRSAATRYAIRRGLV